MTYFFSLKVGSVITKPQAWIIQWVKGLQPKAPEAVWIEPQASYNFSQETSTVKGNS